MCSYSNDGEAVAKEKGREWNRLERQAESYLMEPCERELIFVYTYYFGWSFLLLLSLVVFCHLKFSS